VDEEASVKGGESVNPDPVAMVLKTRYQGFHDMPNCGATDAGFTEYHSGGQL
jgi:hypothetical protein